MTIKLAGLWELGWNTPIKEIDLWEYIAREFQVAQLVMAPVTGIANASVTEVPNLGDFLAAERAAGTTLVFFDENAPVDMKDYTHPPDTARFRQGIAVGLGRVWAADGCVREDLDPGEPRGLLAPSSCRARALRSVPKVFGVARG